MDGDIRIIVTLAALGAGLCLYLILRAVTDSQSKHMRRRLARVKDEPRVKAEGGQESTLRRAENRGIVPFIEVIVKHLLPRPALLRQRLARTGFRLTIGEFAMICLAVTGATAFAMIKFVGLPVALSALISLSLGLGLPHMAINFLIARRLKAFIGQFPEAIDLIVRGLKSGLPVPESIRTVGEEMKDPIGMEFRSAAEKIRLGVPLDEALAEVGERITSAEFRFFVISLSVQRETGGNLAETLENLSEILRRRRQMKQKIKAMSSEANASALILGSLPFVLFGILAAVNYDYVSTLFTDPRGHILVGAALASLGLGVGVMMKMVRFEI